MLAAGHSRHLVRKVTGTLKAILAEAQRNGLATVNAAAPVRVTITRRDEVPIAIPQPAEVAALIDGAEGWFRPFVLVAALAGLRASELRGLPWRAIDFDKRTLTVRQRADEWGAIGAPKSAAGRREIPLAPIVVNALREWKLACPKGELGLVFPTRTGAADAAQQHRRAALGPAATAGAGRGPVRAALAEALLCVMDHRLRVQSQAGAGAARS